MMTNNMKWPTLLLWLDGVFLTVTGAAGVAMDLASHIAGQGPFAKVLFQNPLVIGVIEAHGQATLLGIFILATPKIGAASHHLLLSGLHLLFGTANIAFFEVFQNVGGETQGIAVTIVHFAFVIANMAAVMGSAGKRSRVVPET
jgi:hypothetical protein